MISVLRPGWRSIAPSISWTFVRWLDRSCDLAAAQLAALGSDDRRALGGMLFALTLHAPAHVELWDQMSLLVQRQRA